MSQPQRQHFLIHADTKRSQYRESTRRDTSSRDVNYKSGYQSSQMVYDMRKQVLDKLDIILQKVNISVLKAMDAGTKIIKLISMTQLEEQIQELFRKLDNCIFHREHEFKMNDNDLLMDCENLRQQNRELRSQNDELREYIESVRGGDKESPLDKMSALQKEIEVLNTQVNKYGDYLKENSLNSRDQQRYLSHNKLLQGLHKILKESGRLRLLTLGIKKVFKQYSQTLATFKTDIVSKITATTTKQKHTIQILTHQNSLLREQIQAWEFDIEHQVIQRLPSYN